MAWVALDRGIRAVQAFGLEGPVARWQALRQRIHDEVCSHGFDRQLGSFVQSFGSKELDASLLLLPTVGFLPAMDPRIRSTIEAVERRLFVDGYLLRYDTATSDDGLPEGEGAFLACSFWLADAYVLIGKVDSSNQAGGTTIRILIPSDRDVAQIDPFRFDRALLGWLSPLIGGELGPHFAVVVGTGAWNPGMLMRTASSVEERDSEQTYSLPHSRQGQDAVICSCRGRQLGPTFT